MFGRRLAVLLVVPLAFAASGRADDETPLATFFKSEVGRIAARPLTGITSAAEWKAQRPELKRRLRDMLALEPLPPRTDLKPEVRGIVERPDFVVERLLFQSSPGLYVTANLYRPKTVSKPLPAILYVCGHAKVENNGIIYGCKAHYQHHGAWFAANGYVCLIVDTLQLGELPGLHHGTHHEKMWWWQSRGYTPAGIEAWNGIRAIDYLCSRPEVDKDRIGVTGRSGGGATSWWLGALDDRVKAVAPVAGITDLADHVVNPWANGRYKAGVIEGHCDCMYFVNTYRWDFDTLAALCAPKALLLGNNNADPIFPEPGIRRIYAQMEKVYQWYDASDRLGILIGEGGHVDSPELRHAAFAFFEKHLKGITVDPAKIDEPARAIPIEELRVLSPNEVPADCRNATIHESWLQAAAAPAVPTSQDEWDALRDRWLDQLRARAFGGWPRAEDAVPLDVKPAVEEHRQGIRLQAIDFSSQAGVRLRLWLFTPESDKVEGLTVLIEDESQPRYGRLVSDFLTGSTKALSTLARTMERANAPQTDQPPAIRTRGAVAVVVPRGTGLTAWDDAKDTHLRRRFALIGQTLDGMRVWDILRAAAALRSIPGLESSRVRLEAQGRATVLALFAAALGNVDQVTAHEPGSTLHDGPIFLNVERILTPAQVAALPKSTVIEISTNDPEAWRWTADLARALDRKDSVRLSRPDQP